MRSFALLQPLDESSDDSVDANHGRLDSDRFGDDTHVILLLSHSRSHAWVFANGEEGVSPIRRLVTVEQPAQGTNASGLTIRLNSRFA